MFPLLALLLSAPAPDSLPVEAPLAERRVDDERESLEGFLRRLRKERARARVELRGELDGLLARAQAAAEKEDERELGRIEDELVALGSEAAPLLLPSLDAGSAAEEPGKKVARLVSTTLERVGPTAITEPLLHMARGGSREGRRNAFRVLGAVPDPAVVVPPMVELFHGEDQEMRRYALITLAKQGGPEAGKAFEEALADSDPGVVRLALNALADSRALGVADRVLALVQGARLGEHLSAILAYYRAVPEALSEPVMVALVGAARTTAISNEQREELFDSLAPLELDLSLDVRRAIKDIANGARTGVRDSALLFLAKQGDRSARGELLDPYDETIKRNAKWSDAYTSRAGILYRLEDYKRALRDFRRAIELVPRENRLDGTNHLGMARCHARLGDFKDAAAAIEDAPISAEAVRALAGDPAFAEMIGSGKYDHVFGITR